MRAILRTAPKATIPARTALRTRGDQGAATIAEASANTIPNDGRYRVRSAIRSSIGTTTFATGETVITNQARPRAMPGIVRLVRHAKTPAAAHTTTLSRCMAVSPGETVNSPGE